MADKLSSEYVSRSTRLVRLLHLLGMAVGVGWKGYLMALSPSIMGYYVPFFIAGGGKLVVTALLVLVPACCSRLGPRPEYESVLEPEKLQLSE